MINWPLAILLLVLLAAVKLVFRRNETTSDGAPFVPLEGAVIDRILKLADVKPGDTFYDLGSGDGRLVIAAALKGARAFGIEIDTARVWYSRLWIFLFGLSGKAKIIKKNIHDVDLSKADVITAYLLQETNDKLMPKLQKEVKRGARVVGVAFKFKKWKPEKIDPHGPIYGPLYLYRH